MLSPICGSAVIDDTSLPAIHHVGKLFQVSYLNQLSCQRVKKLQWVDKKKWPPPIIILVLVYMMYNKQ